MTGLILLVTVFGAFEFYVLGHDREIQGSTIIGLPTAVAVVLAFHFAQPALWILALAICIPATFILETIRHPRELQRSLLQTGMTLAGVLYLGFPGGFMVWLRGSTGGLFWVLAVITLTWGTDIFAYLGGRRWGKTKLAPAISPKKTVEGAIVGIIGGIVPTILVLAAGDKLSPLTGMMVAIGPFVAIIGDLFESALKRFFNAKDSAFRFNPFPGHGGVLDRIDALIFVAVYVTLFLKLTGLAG
jgi:phosphatidate cytidylyltransferase